METNNEAVVEFYERLDKLYSVTTEFRNALRACDQEAVTKRSKELDEAIQSIYYFYEKNYTCNRNLADKANALVRQFNAYVPYYNKFFNNPDRMSAAAQECAQKAENEFRTFVKMIISFIDEFKEEVKQIAEEQAKEEGTISLGNAPIDFKPQIIINNENHNENNIDISLSIQQAIKQTENSGLDEETKREVLQKLEEIKQLTEEKTRKKNVWEKVKNILKWVIERGIDVAAIVVPVLGGLVK